MKRIIVGFVLIIVFFTAGCSKQHDLKVTTPAATMTAAPGDGNKPEEKNRFATAEIGDVIKFGTYKQDTDLTNGKEDLEWIVLDKSDGRIFVISKYVIDCKEYNKKVQEDRDPTNCTWETSSLRTWLNKTFFDEAFSESEKSMVLTVKVMAEDNTEYDSDAGNDTQDKVYILSPSEAERYFESNDARKSLVTSYAKTQHNVVNPPESYFPWWLRMPGYDLGYAAYVEENGNIYTRGQHIGTSYPGVRPAMWIEINE